MNTTKKLIIERLRNLKNGDDKKWEDRYYRGWDEGIDEAIEVVRASEEIGLDKSGKSC